MKRVHGGLIKVGQGPRKFLVSFLRLLMSDYPCIHCEELLSAHCECGNCPFTEFQVCNDQLCEIFLNNETKRQYLMAKKREALFGPL